MASVNEESKPMSMEEAIKRCTQETEDFKLKFPQLLTDAHEAEEDVCPICLEPWTNENPSLLSGNCNHSFHIQCVLEWSKRSSLCPCCSVKLKYDFLEEQTGNNVPLSQPQRVPAARAIVNTVTTTTPQRTPSFLEKMFARIATIASGSPSNSPTPQQRAGVHGGNSAPNRTSSQRSFSLGNLFS